MSFKIIILRKLNDKFILFECEVSTLNYPVLCSNQNFKTCKLPHSQEYSCVFQKLFCVYNLVYIISYVQNMWFSESVKGVTYNVTLVSLTSPKSRIW